MRNTGLLNNKLLIHINFFVHAWCNVLITGNIFFLRNITNNCLSQITPKSGEWVYPTYWYVSANTRTRNCSSISGKYFYNYYSVLDWKSNPITEWEYSDTRFWMLKLYGKIQPQNMKNRLIHLKVNIIWYTSSLKFS